MFCNKCGNKIDDGTLFCGKCGSPVESDSLPKKSPEKEECLHGRTASTAAVLTDGNIGFAQQWLMPIVMAGLFVIFFFTGIFGASHGLEYILRNILIFFFSNSILAMVYVLSTRAKGLDISVFGLFSVSCVIIASFNASFGGILLAILACAFLGLINGVLITYLHIPSIIVTFVTGLFTYFLSLLLHSNGFLEIDNIDHSSRLLPAIIFGVIAAGVTLLLLAGKLKKSREERGSDDKSFFNALIYMITGVFSCLYAWLYCVRVNNFSIEIIDFIDYVPLLLFVMFIIYGVIHTRKRILAVPFAAFASLVYSTLYVVIFSVFDTSIVVHRFIISLILLALMIVFAIVNRKRLSDFILLKSKAK